jgi:NADH-quinone oxidoreductase subunit F
MAIAAYAMQIPVGYVFLRYAYEQCAHNVERAIAEAEAKGYLGHDILGTGFAFELHVHRSAGRYILGEETALINGLEGRRPNPRSKPPFPAQRGLFGKPTNVNNVETFANVPHILTGGADWYKSLAMTPDGAGTLLVGLSGHLHHTAVQELPMGIPLRVVIDECGGGVRRGRRFKACLPGGASTPFLTAAQLDTPLDHLHLEQAGSRLGTAGVVVFDETICMVAATLNLARFFARESCGWCTPCRDGLQVVAWLLEEIEAGRGTADLLAMLGDQVKNISGRAFCALAEGAMGPVKSLLDRFGDELEDHVKQGRCPLRS